MGKIKKFIFLFTDVLQNNSLSFTKMCIFIGTDLFSPKTNPHCLGDILNHNSDNLFINFFLALTLYIIMLNFIVNLINDAYNINPFRLYRVYLMIPMKIRILEHLYNMRILRQNLINPKLFLFDFDKRMWHFICLEYLQPFNKVASLFF